MLKPSHNGSHSASVRMTLQIGEDSLDVTQATPDRIFLRQPVDLPPCEGVLDIEIDGQKTSKMVRLPHGANESDRSVEVN